MFAGQNHSNFSLNTRLSAPRYDTWCKIQVLTWHIKNSANDWIFSMDRSQQAKKRSKRRPSRKQKPTQSNFKTKERNYLTINRTVVYSLTSCHTLDRHPLHFYSALSTVVRGLGGPLGNVEHVWPQGVAAPWLSGHDGKFRWWKIRRPRIHGRDGRQTTHPGCD
jgi:hypothetical protein